MKVKSVFWGAELFILPLVCFLLTAFAVGAIADPSSQPAAGSAGNSGQSVASPFAADSPSQMLASSFKYIHITGNTFVPRGATVTKNWAAPGCIYLSSSGMLAARLDLPKDATIKYLRIYYNVTHLTAYMTTWLVQYNTANAANLDLASVASETGGGGLGTSLSPEISEVVNNSAYSYEINISIPGGSDVAFCGVRIAYYDPSYLIIQ